MTGLHRRWGWLALCGVLGCAASSSDSGDRSGNVPSGTKGKGSKATGGKATDAGADAMQPAMGSGGMAGATDAGMADDAGPKHVVPPTPAAPEPCSVSGCPPDLMCEASGVCVTPPPACVGDKDCDAN